MMGKIGPKNIFKREWVVVMMVWVVIALGIILRVYEGDKFPIDQNDDGLFYVWMGNSTLDNFWEPTSLTIFEKDNKTLFWRSQYKDFEPKERFGFRMTNKWFDAPPLGAMLIAIPSRLMGYRGFEQVPQMLVRVPAFIAAVATLFLTYWLGKELFGQNAGWLGLLVLAVWPLAVWSQRQSYLENLITPLWLLGLVMVNKIGKSKSYLGMMVIVSLISGWIKFTGFAVGTILVFWLLRNKKRKEAVIVGGATVLSLGLYLLYGQLVGGEIFWRTFGSQAGRGAYLSSWFHILQTPKIYGVVRDGWWYLGWLAVMWLGFFQVGKQKKEREFLILNIVFWMVVVFLTSGPANTSAWYRYPIYPLLAIGLGEVINRFIKKPGLLWAVLFFVLGLTGWELAGIEFNSNWLRLLMVVVMVMFGGEYLVKLGQKWLVVRRSLALILVGLMVVGNIAAVRNYQKRICKDGNCLEPTKIILEGMH